MSWSFLHRERYLIAGQTGSSGGLMAAPTAAINDLKEWLQGLGLEKYADAFAREEIELEVIAELTDTDLQSLGIPMGPRKQILRAIDQLKQASTSAAAPPVPRNVEEPERRQLTVMFCDLISTTALSRQLDPEDMRDLIRAYQDLVVEHVARFDGHIASFAGDGVKVYFGFPTALENQAERAIRAAKSISDAIGSLRTPAQEPLAIRIGVATGPVVVGDLIGKGAAQEELVVGETPNLAARLQQLAEPGETVISATTRQLVGELFELQGPGRYQLKGFGEPVEAWRVLGEGQIASRFDALRAFDATPLIGRNGEIALLDERWALARQGKGQVTVLSGEPGIGKSRVARNFLRELPGILRLNCHTNAGHISPAALCIHSSSISSGGLMPDRMTAAAMRRAFRQIRNYSCYPPSKVRGRQPREKFFEAYVDYVRQLSKDRPVLFLVEDVHWADPSSLELLDLVIAGIADCGVLVLITFRPQFDGISRKHGHVTLLTLNRCDRASVIAMVNNLAAGEGPVGSGPRPNRKADRWSPALRGRIDQSDNRNRRSLRQDRRSHEIPRANSGHGYNSLMVRLDRLGPAKRVAQLASAIGREFSYDVLHAISQFERKDLDAALKNLVAAEIVYPLQHSPGVTYIFKHALVQDAAYQSLLARQLHTIHASIADILAEKFPTIPEREPELLAHHLTLARQDRRAIPYWQLAGQRAARISSYIEASNHLNHALALLRSLPDASKDARQELDLMVGLATVQLATRGYGAPDVAAAFSEAKKRCHQLGGSEHLMTVLFGEWACGIHRQPLDDVVRLSRGLRRVAKSTEDVGDSLMGDRALGNSLLFAGRFAQARLYLSRAAQAYDEERHQKLALRYGLDLKTASLSLLLMTEWAVGSPHEAAETGKQAIAHAERIEHGNSIAHALIHGGLFLEQFQNKPAQILRYAERLGEISERGGFRMFLAWCRILEGWALFELGEQSKGTAQMQDGIRSAQDTGSILYQPYFLTLLGSSYGAQLDFEKGLEAIEDAIRFVEDRGERWYAAEVYRVKGELSMRGGGDRNGATRALRHALDIAHRQRSASFTQRVQSSLAELDAVYGR